jgi:hypothetical protein
MTRQEITDVFLVRALPAERVELRRTLERMSKEELEEAYKVLQLQATEERLLEIQAERAADLAMHQYHSQQAREPQRRAEEKVQLEADRKTFAEAAKTLRSFALNEANFNLIRQTLGQGFSVFAVQQMVAANGATLSPPTQQELDEWTRQEIEAHNLRLLNADIPTLRKLAREAGAQIAARPPAQADETQRVRQAERAESNIYPPLPEEIRIGDREEVLDAAFIKRCSRETYRFLMGRYGSAQITEALRTRRSDASPLW